MTGTNRGDRRSFQHTVPQRFIAPLCFRIVFTLTVWQTAEVGFMAGPVSCQSSIWRLRPGALRIRYFFGGESFRTLLFGWLGSTGTEKVSVSSICYLDMCLQANLNPGG